MILFLTSDEKIELENFFLKSGFSLEVYEKKGDPVTYWRGVRGGSYFDADIYTKESEK